jgi:hypothetical protein
MRRSINGLKVVKPEVTNEFGMMGKYQFSPSTVRVLGFNVSRRKDFLEIQNSKILLC